MLDPGQPLVTLHETRDWDFILHFYRTVSRSPHRHDSEVWLMGFSGPDETVIYHRRPVAHRANPARWRAILRACPAARAVALQRGEIFVLVDDAAYERDLGASIVQHVATVAPGDVARLTVLPERDRNVLVRRGCRVRAIHT